MMAMLSPSCHRSQFMETTEGAASRPGVAKLDDVGVMVVGIDSTALADRLEHPQIGLMADEVEVVGHLRERLLEVAEAPNGLLDREHLDRPPFLIEVTEERCDDLFSSGRARSQGIAENLGSPGSASREDGCGGAISPQHRGRSVGVVDGGRKALRCHQQNELWQGLGAHHGEHVQGGPHTRTGGVDIERRDLELERVGDGAGVGRGRHLGADWTRR